MAETAGWVALPRRMQARTRREGDGRPRSGTRATGWSDGSATRAGERHRTGTPLALAVSWAALLTVPLGVAHAGAALVRPGPLLAGAGVALLSAVLPYSLELAALRRLPPSTVAVPQSLEPAAAGVAGALVLDERLRAIRWLALACVGVANAGILTRYRRAGP